MIAVGGGPAAVPGRAAAILLAEQRSAPELCRQRLSNGEFDSPRLALPSCRSSSWPPRPARPSSMLEALFTTPGRDKGWRCSIPKRGRHRGPREPRDRRGAVWSWYRTSRRGLASVLAHALGHRSSMANGIVNAIVLPQTMRFNAPDTRHARRVSPPA
jgi:hypothetical protein